MAASTARRPCRADWSRILIDILDLSPRTDLHINLACDNLGSFGFELPLNHLGPSCWRKASRGQIHQSLQNFGCYVHKSAGDVCRLYGYCRLSWGRHLPSESMVVAGALTTSFGRRLGSRLEVICGRLQGAPD